MNFENLDSYQVTNDNKIFATIISNPKLGDITGEYYLETSTQFELINENIEAKNTNENIEAKNTNENIEAKNTNENSTFVFFVSEKYFDGSKEQAILHLQEIYGSYKRAEKHYRSLKKSNYCEIISVSEYGDLKNVKKTQYHIYINSAFSSSTMPVDKLIGNCVRVVMGYALGAVNIDNDLNKIKEKFVRRKVFINLPVEIVKAKYACKGSISKQKICIKK